jgi:hypothetical protein
VGVITENGWPQCTREECETLLVPGTESNEVRIELRKGDVATILTAWAAWYHRNVRPINNEHTRDCWGWCATNGAELQSPLGHRRGPVWFATSL